MFAALCASMACSQTTEPSSVRSAISACYDESDPACLDGLESSEPDDVFDACFTEHAECLASGAPDACDPLLDACFEIYDESDDTDDAIGFCYEEAEQCTRDLGVAADECLDMLSMCLASIDEPVDVPDAPDVAEVCFEGHAACLEGMGDPAECDAILDECLIAACPPDHPIEPEDPCLVAIEACVEDAPDGEHAAMCADVAEGCYEPEPDLPPCEEEFFACLEASGFEDPAACEEILWACEPPADDPSDCEEEFIRCAEMSADPAACEEILWSCEPPDEGPWCEDEYAHCLEAVGADDPAICEEILWSCEHPGDMGEPRDCEAEFGICLESGETPDVCEELRCLCEGD